MTLDQILAFTIVATMMVLFIWGRFRYDLVALMALVAGIVTGIVPYADAFKGFADDIVIIVASALLVSAAISRSGVIESALKHVSAYTRTTQSQVVVLVSAVTLMSGFMKNIGALAMLIPVAFQFARRSNSAPSQFLMPMAFGSLLGGLVTLVGTSPNIIVSRLRGEIVGEPFTMFDFTPVGLTLALAGIAFLSIGYRLLPKDRRSGAGLNEALDIKDYTTEARVAADSDIHGLTLGEFDRMNEREVVVTSIIRAGHRRMTPLPDLTFREDDILLLTGEPDALERAVARGGLRLVRENNLPQPEEGDDEVGAIEAIVGPASTLAGQTAGRIDLFERHGVNLIAVSRAGERITQRLREIELRSGDVVLLQGNLKRMPDTLKDLGCLPLATRSIPLGNVRRGQLAVGILAVAVGLVAFGVVPITISFFVAAVLLVLTGVLPLREAYNTLDWPLLIMLGALIPVSEAIRTTGGTEVIAGWISMVTDGLPAFASVAVIMIAAMAVTPFLNNAATVLVMAPIAASLAASLGYRPDAFLMAVAIGAGSDFLTPIGHQCNMLVMGPGGYRFGDYWRLGLPLSILVVLAGTPLILLFWPLS